MMVRREYWLNGNLYKELANYYDNGKIYTERYFMNGYLHREDGPAIIYYSDNGSIKLEKYYQNGELHRLDGPAYICYHKGLCNVDERYYINDIEYTDIFLYTVAVGSMED